MGAHILVINDTQDILDLFRTLLEEEGYQVTTYSFAPQDIYEVERVQPDLVILDFIFGTELIGWQLLQKMRMYAPTAKIPVVVCTAATRQVREIEGQLQSHNTTLVGKPFDIEELLRAVASLLAIQGQTHNSSAASDSPDASGSNASPGKPAGRKDKESK